MIHFKHSSCIVGKGQEDDVNVINNNNANNDNFDNVAAVAAVPLIFWAASDGEKCVPFPH